jgi:integrase
MVQLKQGVTINKVLVEDVVAKFLRHKKSRVRDTWEGKEDAGKKSITKERWELIEGKLRNYLVPFLGAKTDIRNIPSNRWLEWEVWRREQVRHGKPAAVTIQNEMGMIREFWKWAMENSYIPFAPKLPFHDENLITDDKARRDTWEATEWSSFARKVREWLKAMETKAPDEYWDAFVAYQMLFFLANSGMRSGELVKVKRKDIRFYKREGVPPHKALCALVQVHKSTKTGAREVNAMGGVFARRVWEKSNHQKKEDFLFCHLDGRQFSTKDFWKEFNKMIAFTKEEERWGKHFVPYSLRHFYATTRLQNGTSKEALCKNMGCGETYLRKHYSHYLARLATADLMVMRSDIGLGGEMLKEGDDFAVIDEVTK